MLMESVSDPRRANWLTISMSEDLCWPDEPSTTRPNWELEAEILRLTTRLMLREGEVRQVKAQLKAQTSKAQQQAASWRRRMEEKEEQLKELLLQKDAEMQNIVSQLLLFEAELRREQARIEDLLSEKDRQIEGQRKEIDSLKNSGERSSVSGDKSSGYEECNSEDIFSTVISGDRNFRTSNSEDRGYASRTANSDDRIPTLRTSSFEDRGSRSGTANSEDRDSIFKTFSLEDKNFGYGSVNPRDRSSAFKASDSDDRSLIYRTSNSEDSGVVISSSDSCPSPLEDISDMVEDYSKGHYQLPVFEDSQSNSSGTLKDTKEGLRNRHSKSSLFKDSYEDGRFNQSKTLKDKCDAKEFHKEGHFIFQDPFDSQLAVQKLRDGLGKIRAIQDVTNVKSLELSHDCVVPEKKRMPYKAPQKMKDLKAKRSINPHKSHRNVNDLNNQVIL